MMPTLQLTSAPGGSQVENSSMGSQYGDGAAENTFVQKVSAVMVGINHYTTVTGTHVVYLYQGATLLCTKTVTLSAGGFNLITFDTPVEVAAGTTYRAVVNFPSYASIYYASGLYDGTMWRNTACKIGGNPYTSYTLTMGFAYLSVAYHESGTAVYGPYQLPTVSSFRMSIIDWTVTTPAGTSVAVAAAVVDRDATPQAGGYSTVTKGIAIPGISSGKDLFIKITLVTTDTTKTPSLSGIWLEYEGSDDRSKIRVTLTSQGRMKYPQGTVTVAYAAAQGDLKNEAGTMSIASFSREFIPAESAITKLFNPNGPENIQASLDLTTEVYAINYINNKDDESIQAALDLTVSVYDTSSNPV